MSQLSLFSADLTPPQLADLGGLLAAHGRLIAGPDGVRLSIPLAESWRADALLRECRVRDVPAEIIDPGDIDPGDLAPANLAPGEVTRGDTEPGEVAPGDTSPGDANTGSGPPGSPPMVLLRTEPSTAVSRFAALWFEGESKTVPAEVILTAGLLRCWTLAAGRPADVGFLLGLDPAAPDTHEPLAAACAAAGLAGSLLGVRGGGPAVRIVGYRRCSRLAEMIGTPPPEAPPGVFPALSH